MLLKGTQCTDLFGSPVEQLLIGKELKWVLKEAIPKTQEGSVTWVGMKVERERE